MSTATSRDAPEVYYPKWLDTRIVCTADAVGAAIRMIGREDAFLLVMEESEDEQSTAGARQVWGAERVLEDVRERLLSIRAHPVERADELDGRCGELWGLSYRCYAAETALRINEAKGSNAPEVVQLVRALADGLSDLGAIYDERRCRAMGGTS